MAVPVATRETERLIEQWKCKACAEVWEIVQGDSVVNGCPECRGPLRLISRPPSHHNQPTERSLVALSEDQQWLVVHRPDAQAPWTVLQRRDDIDGYSATGDSYEDFGQSAEDILATLLATSRARHSLHLQHTAAD